MDATNANVQSHQRSKSAVLKSFVHRRQPSQGVALSPQPQEAKIENVSDYKKGYFSPALGNVNMGVVGQYVKNNPGALGELQQNQQEAAPRDNQRGAKDRDGEQGQQRGRSRSPTKSAFTLPFMPSPTKDTDRPPKTREDSPTKPKKTKSGTNLAALLSRPKPMRSMNNMSADEESPMGKDKENRTPDSTPDFSRPPPIFAQFASDISLRQHNRDRASIEIVRRDRSRDPTANISVKERPRSFQVPPRAQTSISNGSSYSTDDSRKGSQESGATKSQRGRIMAALKNASQAASRARSKSRSRVASPVVEQLKEPKEQRESMETNEPELNPKDIDKHLEAMLDRRNIPENQRYKMRNLNDTIKMEFIRQDWAEMAAARGDGPGSKDSINSHEGASAVATGEEAEDERPKRTRGKSFTFSRGKKENRSVSPQKKSRGEGTIGRHFRSKSTESVGAVSDRPTSSGSSTGSSLFSKIKLQQGPGDYVAYMRKTQKPEHVEVGKIHKLRLLLRNETVAWIEEFIQLGGMKEIVNLLYRIMNVEWREEHEDALLHENLLCLKALSTTARALQYIHDSRVELFPKLLHLIFDPEKKGPSEFTTRNIITSILFTYIESAPPGERIVRAKTVLTHLRDPEPKENERPLPFVMEMRQERPYRVWNKEVVNVTKEVFWIFLHNLNVIALPSERKSPGAEGHDAVSSDDALSYMTRHFPQERPPVPAAPYVGGVEWDATNYLTSHLDLLNAILACTPTREARNAIRAQLQISGWERCMGGSMRLCKEKFYGNVHDGLRTWAAAAADDGWETRDVRYGPPPEARSPRKTVGAPRKKEKDEPAPKLDMPRLDFGLDKGPSTPIRDDTAWIS